MHSPEIRQKFIELRADAHSIPKIASLLNVAQSTLRLWEKDDALEIAHLRCSYWQDAEDKVGITIEHRLRRMAEWIKGAEDELEKRHFDLMNNRDLMRFLREARREYFRLRAMLFNAPGAKTREHTPRTRNTPVASATAEGGRDAAPSASAEETDPLTPAPRTGPSLVNEIPPTNTPLQRGEPEQPYDSPTASAVSPSETASDKIDKIGELADFPKTQPRNTNDLQQPKSSSADFEIARASQAALPKFCRDRDKNLETNPCCNCNSGLESAAAGTGLSENTKNISSPSAIAAAAHSSLVIPSFLDLGHSSFQSEALPSSLCNSSGPGASALTTQAI